MEKVVDCIVVGGGPSGLRAAEVVAAKGRSLVLCDAMPSVGRKFLVAGKGGLNFTNISERLAENYRGSFEKLATWEDLLRDADSAAFRKWVSDFGIESVVKPNGRVYPAGMKSAPLLRRWVERLRASGVRFLMRHRLVSLRQDQNSGWCLGFDTPLGNAEIFAKSVVLALGGGSWPQTGSDGKWQEILLEKGIEVTPFYPANCGWDFTDSVFQEAAGLPLKNIVVRCGSEEATGELLVTDTGFEGGCIYRLTPFLRKNPNLFVDLKPSFSREQLLAKLMNCKRFHLQEAIERCRIQECGRRILLAHPAKSEWLNAQIFVEALKALPFSFRGPRPLDEAISSAGGVCWSELDEGLMLRKMRGVFLAGEMIDWEAPTGGYLLQGCFSLGTRSGKSALTFLENAKIFSGERKDA